MAGYGSLLWWQQGSLSASSFRPIWIEAIFPFKKKTHFSCHSAQSFNVHRISIKGIRVCVTANALFWLVSGFYGNTANVKMKIICGLENHKNHHHTRGVASRTLRTIRQTCSSLTFPSKDGVEDRPFWAGWWYKQLRNGSERGTWPLCVTKTTNAHLQYNYHFQKRSQFSSFTGRMRGSWSRTV